MTEVDIVKKCSRCGEEKPLTSDHFQRDASMRDGFKAACKACRNSQKKRESSPPSVAAVKRSPEDEALSAAKQFALRKLVENHPREFQQCVNSELERRGYPKRWQQVV